MRASAGLVNPTPAIEVWLAGVPTAVAMTTTHQTSMGWPVPFRRLVWAAGTKKLSATLLPRLAPLRWKAVPNANDRFGYTGCESISSKIGRARPAIPGDVDSRGPAMFSVAGRNSASHAIAPCAPSTSIWIKKQGRLCRLQSRAVSNVPPLSLRSNKISVASLSITFCAVRAAYFDDEYSVSWYFAGTVPSSAKRPLGHQPP